MKILIISRFFPYVGGRESVVMELADGFSKQNEVAIATPDFGRSSKNYKIFGLNNLEKFIQQFKPDIINYHTFYLTTPEIINYAQKRNAKIILTIHGDIFGFGSFKDRRLFKSIAEKLDKLVVVCESGFRQMVDNGISKEKIKVINNGVNTEVFRNYLLNKETLKKSLRLPSNKKIFVTPMRMTSYKGLDFLIEGIRKIALKNIYFVIATPATRYREDEMRYMEKILKKAARYKILGKFEIKFFDYAAMPFLYQAADGFILPSQTEQMPITVLEAMSSELPVIATNVGGMQEIIINGKDGFLLEYGDVKHLKYLIYKIFHFSKNQAGSIGRQSRMTVQKKFQSKSMIDCYLNLFKYLS